VVVSRVNWDEVAEDTVGVPQAAAGFDPYDRDLTDLIGELSTLSDESRELWARQDVHILTRGLKHMNHPDVGHLELRWQVLNLASEQGLSMVIATAEPNTASHDALTLLGALTAGTERLQLSTAAAEGPATA
jgi:hypothetical protein